MKKNIYCMNNFVNIVIRAYFQNKQLLEVQDLSI